jgi:hypothetical protein
MVAKVIKICAVLEQNFEMSSDFWVKNVFLLITRKAISYVRAHFSTAVYINGLQSILAWEQIPLVEVRRIFGDE